MNKTIAISNGLSVFSILLALISMSSTAATIYEAEDAAVINEGNVESEHAGHTGTGYVNFNSVLGAYCEWNVSQAESGTYNMSIHYANGASDRPMKIIVNEIVVVESMPFLPTGGWTTWKVDSVYIPLNSGLNTLRIESVGLDGPNLDKITISGEPGTPYYILDIRQFGEGSVTIDPDLGVFSEGTSVSIAASANAGYSFVGWRGNVRSDETTINVQMDSNLVLMALFLRNGAYARTDELVGWAGYESEITGGEGGTVVTASTLSELKRYTGSSDKYIIRVKGTIEITPFGDEIPVGSNTTVIGSGHDATLVGGGLYIGGATNVIVKNLTFRDAYVDWEGKTTDNDAIEVNNSKGVWITQCDLSHYDDGLIDIKNASDFVTVSWCHFHNHHKVMLIGAADDATQDIGHLNVTVHHNWFDGSEGNGVGVRMPAVRFGKVHVFNNFYNDVLTRCIGVGFDGNVVADNNYFLKSEMPHALVGGPTGGDNKMNVSGNIYIESGTRRDKDNRAFDPNDYYQFNYNQTEDVPAVVMWGAGIGADTAIGTPTAIEDLTGTAGIYNKAFLHAYPNPFSDHMTVKYDVPRSSDISIQLYDIVGNLIATLIDENTAPGSYMLEFDGTPLNTGVYYIKMNTGSRIYTVKTMKINYISEN